MIGNRKLLYWRLQIPRMQEVQPTEVDKVDDSPSTFMIAISDTHVH